MAKTETSKNSRETLNQENNMAEYGQFNGKAILDNLRETNSKPITKNFMSILGNGEYTLSCKFADKDIPKSEGFRWNATDKSWTSKDGMAALKVIVRLATSLNDMATIASGSALKQINKNIPQATGIEILKVAGLIS